MSPRIAGDGAERRFLLACTPDEGGAELAPEDVPHALRVLRLVPGDRLIGLDGRGAAWPLRIASLGRAGPMLEQDGEPRREPAPGAADSAQPWLELLVALPRGERAESMATRLTELGVSRLVPWIVSRSAAGARDLAPARRRRIERAMAEATKQCGRLWLPELGETLIGLGEPIVGLPERAGDESQGEAALLEPSAAEGFLGWARERASAGARRLALWVGPEGGLAPEERATLERAGARPLALAANVLRIETAAEAAAAIVGACWLER